MNHYFGYVQFKVNREPLKPLTEKDTSQAEKSDSQMTFMLSLCSPFYKCWSCDYVQSEIHIHINKTKKVWLKKFEYFTKKLHRGSS